MNWLLGVESSRLQVIEQKHKQISTKHFHKLGAVLHYWLRSCEQNLKITCMSVWLQELKESRLTSVQLQQAATTVQYKRMFAYTFRSGLSSALVS